jgi:hypothetical protein
MIFFIWVVQKSCIELMSKFDGTSVGLSGLSWPDPDLTSRNSIPRHMDLTQDTTLSEQHPLYFDYTGTGTGTGSSKSIVMK